MAPFILYLPGKDAKKIEAITSHLDIAPTLLELMGSSTNHDNHSLGISLLSNIEENRNFIVSSGWGESAIITEEATLVFLSLIHISEPTRPY